MSERFKISVRAVFSAVAFALATAGASSSSGQDLPEADPPTDDEVASERGPAVAVIEPVGDADLELRQQLATAIGEAVFDRGLGLISAQQVSVALAGDQAPGSDAELVEMARRFSVAAVIAASAQQVDEGIALRVRLVPADGGDPVAAERELSADEALSQVRTIVGGLLDIALPGAVAPPTPAPAPAPTAAPLPVPPPAAGPTPVVFGMDTAPPPPAETEVEVQGQVAAPPPQVGRVFAVFGATAGIHAAGWVIALALWIETDQDSFGYDKRNVAYLYTAIVPVASSALGWVIGNSSRYWDVSYPAVLLGAYLGAGTALGIALLSSEHGDDDVGEFFAWSLVPIMLPGIGAAIAYAAARRPEGRGEQAGRPLAIALGDGVEWTLPGPTVYPASDGSRRHAIGLSMGVLYF
jgi:hypothetical protein